ncbi:FHA domain protein [compost metagenome]
MTFGRSVKCELCFSDLELSRRHCEFFLKDDVLEVKDLASANGVFVNQQKVSTAVLQPGDQVRMGSVTLLVIGPRVAAPQVVDEDATLFMPVVQLPKATAPRPAGRQPVANPLRAAAHQEAAQADAPRQAPNRLLLGLLVLVIAVAGAFAGKTLL